MPCTTSCTRFSVSPNAIMRSKPKASHWIGTSMSDTTLVTATARVGAMRQSRSSVAKLANINPAVTKDEAARPDGCERVGADHGEPGDDDERAYRALRRQLFLQHHRCQHQPARRGAGGWDHAAMGERYEQEPGIAQERERRPAHERQRAPLGPAPPAEIAQARAGDERQEGEPRPDEAGKRDVGRRKPGRDTVARRHEPRPPAQRRAGAP